MGNTYGTSFVNNDEIKIRTPILITYYKDKINKAEDNILNIDVTRIRLQNDVTAKEAAFKAAETYFKATPTDITKEAAFKSAKGALDLANAELANLTPKYLTEELHKILKDPLEWDIPEISTLFEETKKKYPIPEPPTTSGSSSGPPVASSGAPARKPNWDWMLKPTKGGKARILKKSDLKTFIQSLAKTDQVRIELEGIIDSKPDNEIIQKMKELADAGLLIPTSYLRGGARPSRKHRKTPERQSYRRPRTRGIATRKNHRLRQGE
jgi:hypothetical protein